MFHGNLYICILNNINMNIQVIKGSLLGDMWIQKSKISPNSYQYRFEQSEFEYSLWKAKMTGSKFTLIKRKRLDKRNNKISVEK